MPTMTFWKLYLKKFVYSVCKVCDLIDLIHLLLHLLAFFLPPPFHNTSSSRISDNQLSLKWIAPLFHTT